MLLTCDTQLELSDLKILQPLQIKDHLVSLAKKELPKHMGNRFTSIVITCLTCLDEENIDFGDETEFQDNEGILVNVRYIEKVNPVVCCLQCTNTF